MNAAPVGSFADLDEVERFARHVAAYQAGQLDAEEFRRIRLWMGVYGQRGEPDIHMLRLKLPQGRLDAAQVRVIAEIAETHSRGFAHVTTRQNVQLHFIPLEQVPNALRAAARAGITTREACGDTVRNVTACHLAGVCPLEVSDVSLAGERITRHFLRNPLSQDLPRKFKIALSGCAADCAITGIHDVGIIATRLETGEAGYRILVGGGLGATPREADTLEPFTPADDLLITTEAILRIYDRSFDAFADRAKRSHSRLKVLIDRMGIEVFREAVWAERQKLRGAAGIDRGTIETRMSQPPEPSAAGSHHDALAAIGLLRGGFRAQDLPPGIPIPSSVEGWRATNTIEQSDGFVAAFVSLPLGDITAAQLRALATFLDAHAAEVRTTNRQNLVIRSIPAHAVAPLHDLLVEHGLAEATNDRVANLVSCPGAETCNLALTASRGLGQAIREALVSARLDQVPGVRINISGCQNSCGQHHVGDIGLWGFARRDSTGNEAPAYRILVGAGIDDGGVRFGQVIGKPAARNTPAAVVRIVERFARERLAEDESFPQWVDRVTADAIASSVTDLEHLPERADDATFFEDWGMTDAFKVILGRGECAS